MAYYEDIIKTGTDIKCKLCSISLRDDDIVIDEHVNGWKHKYLEVRKALAQQGVVLMDKMYYCYVCNQNISKNLRFHLKEPKHISKVKTFDKNYRSVLDISDSGQAHCALCDCSVNVQELSDHIASIKHKRIKAIVVQPYNGIFSVKDDCDYVWCKFCKSYIHNNIESIFDHVENDTEHITSVAKMYNLIKDQNISLEKYLMDPAEPTAYCKKCDTTVPCNLDNVASHIKGKTHRK